MAYKKPLKKDSSPKIICQNKGCSKMGKYQSINDFYKSRSEALPHHPYCKTCINEMIDVGDLNTVYEILKVLDTPFIMDVWNGICLTRTKNYLGDYLKMVNFTKKNIYNDLKWADSVFELSDEQGKFAEEFQKQIDETPAWNDEWQGKYSKSDLKYLNDYYAGLLNDFKITTINHKDYARKIAQASLSQAKAYQSVMEGKDGADVAYEKATRMFDMLSKSANFTESTRSANDVSLGSFGRVFEVVEQHNWIPIYEPTDEDMYDKLIKQFKNIEKSL